MKKVTQLILAGIFMVSCTNKDYEKGTQFLAVEKYNEALDHFTRVEASDENYEEAQTAIIDIENIVKENTARKIIEDSIAAVEKREKDLASFKEQLQNTIDDVSKFNPSETHRNSVEALQLEVLLFEDWGDLVRKAEAHEDKEVQASGKRLQSNVVRLQKSEFPKIRKNFGEVSDELMWENNMEVRAFGNGYSIIEFTAGMFANNKNKKDAQAMLSENLHLFRFKQSRYKWYEHDDEYTYYTMKSKADGELE
jgi:hypothetical protein